MRGDERRRLLLPLVAEFAEQGSGKILERLWREGLIDVRALERRAIGREVNRRVRGGESVGVAMRVVADRFCCSYEKVRSAVYRTKNGFSEK